jgi:hypothetical protein
MSQSWGISPTYEALFFLGIALLSVAVAVTWHFKNPASFARARQWFGDNFEAALSLVVAFVIGVAEILHALISSQPWSPDLTRGLTLVVLATLAYAILRDRKQRGALIKEVRLATEGTGDIRIFSSWNEQEVQNLIASARKSITIVDSWFDEAVPLAHLIDRAKSQIPQLKVDVFMADKDLPYGAQRIKEIGSERLQRINEGDNDFNKMYRELFDVAVKSLQIYVSDSAIDREREAGDAARSSTSLTIYAHALMPGIRLIVIDEATENAKFIFSWFPLGSVSVKNVCLSVSKDSVSERDRLTARHLEGQLKVIRQHSRTIVPVSQQVAA